MPGGSPESKTGLYSKNTSVTNFNNLVNNSSSGANSGDFIFKDPNNSTTFNRSDYTSAQNLPEAKGTSFVSSESSDNNYGSFKGGSVYIKDSSSNFVLGDRSVQPQDGWATPMYNHSEYLMFKGGVSNESYYIKYSDFNPKPLIDDQKPLHEVLQENNHNKDESVIKDTKSASSTAATNKEKTSNDVNNDSDRVDNIDANNGSKSADTGEQTKDIDIKYFGIYPQQIESLSYNQKNDSVYNNIQAVVYDLPNGVSDTLTQSMHCLLCYQQPDSVAYTAAAQYDTLAPRGAQVPYQFYNNASAMQLSFSLNWHIDEIRTLAKDEDTSYTIQDIAQIAEDFTRPWKVGNSLRPKLCKVILPGVSQIGYMQDAQITYDGPMTGDYTTGSGVLTGSGTSIEERTIYNYFYSKIAVNFTMLIVKDVQLQAASSGKGPSMTLIGEGENTNTTNTATSDSSKENKVQAEQESAESSSDSSTPDTALSKEEEKDTKDNSANQISEGTKNSNKKKSSNKKNKKKKEVESENEYDFTEPGDIPNQSMRTDIASFENSPPMSSVQSSTASGENKRKTVWEKILWNSV